MMDDKQIQNICKIGKPECCRYLVSGAGGFECAKVTPMKGAIDSRSTTMKAKGDNCAGYGAKRFTLKTDQLGHSAGSEFVEITSYDYGMKSDHARITGEPHINLSEDGDYPFICVPVSQTQLIL